MDPIIEYVTKKVEENEVSICTIGGGAVLEMIDETLGRGAENATDPNTVVKAKRQIVVKIDIIPSSDRTLLAYEVSVSFRPIGMAPVSGTADVTSIGRGVMAKIRKNKQLPMFDNMVPFQRSKD
jgi:hypothetical protein